MLQEDKSEEVPVAVTCTVEEKEKKSTALTVEERVEELKEAKQQMLQDLQLEIEEDRAIRDKLYQLECTAELVREWYVLWEDREELLQKQESLLRKENRKRRAVDQWRLRVMQASHTVDENAELEMKRVAVLHADLQVQRQPYPTCGVSDAEWTALVRLEKCKLTRLQGWIDSHPARFEALEMERAQLEKELQMLCKVQA